MKKTVKDKVKAKAKAAKEKTKGKLKGRRAAVAAALLALAFVAGCLTPEQASRSTNATYDRTEPTIKVVIDERAHGNTVTITQRITIGDGAIASADSSGSTETQTQTPTFDIKPDIDVRYNDAIAGATSASKTVLGAIGDGLESVLKLMQSKEEGVVTVTKKDGTSALVTCKDGQCSFCEDGNCTPE